MSYGARMLWQKRPYSAIAVLTLALGIGANTAIFSVVNTVLLKPLPFNEPDRVMALGQQTTQTRAALSQFSFRNFADMREQSRSFDRDVRTTMTYTHVPNRGGRGVTSSLDQG